MKRIFAISLLLAVTAAPEVFACSVSNTIANYNATGPYFVGDTVYANLQGFYFVPGVGDPALGSGKDNGTRAVSTWTGDNGAGFFVFGDWNSPGTDLCPVLADPISVVIGEPLNNAATTHSFRFVMATVNFDPARTGWNYDHTGLAGGRITNGIPTMQAVPTPLLTSSAPGGPGTRNFTLQWTAPTNGAQGYFDVTHGPILSSWEVFYWIDTDTTAGGGGVNVPNTGTIGACGTPGACWFSLGNTVNGSSTSFTTGNLAYNSASNAVWFALRPNFISATATPFRFGFVGGNGAQVGPTATGAIAAQSAQASGSQASVDWTSSNETGIASYQVMWAAKEGGPYRAVGRSVAPRGNGSSYSVSFRIPKARSHFFKIQANHLNGTSESTDPIRATR